MVQAKEIAQAEEQLAQNAMGDELALCINVEPLQDRSECCVVWAGLCGYLNVTFHVETPEEARALFEALKFVHEYDAI